MKKIILIVLAVITLMLAACSNAAVVKEKPVSFSESNTEITEMETETTEISTTELTTVENSTTQAETTATTTKRNEPATTNPTTTQRQSTTKQHTTVQPTTTQKQSTTKKETTTAKATTTQKQTTTKKETTTAAPSVDIASFVSYAKNYGKGLGLNYDSSVTDCWDTPIVVSATNGESAKRDIRSRLNRYKNVEGFTGFSVWYEKRSDGKYNLYIGYN